MLRYDMRKHEQWLWVVLLIITPLLFLSGPEFLSKEIVKALFNLGHIPLFVIAIYLVHKRLPLNNLRRWLATLAIVLLLGVCIELIQGLIGRESSFHDIYRNLLGTILVISWLQVPSKRVWLVRGCVSLLVFFEVVAFGLIAADEVKMAQQLPMLADFETPRSVKYWYGKFERSQEFHSEGRYSLKVFLSTEQYSGVTMIRFPGNWSNYQTIKFDVYNPNDETLALIVRIHDVIHNHQYSDRFNREIAAEPGWNNYEFSLKEVKAAPNQIQNAPNQRLMDMKKIENVTLFVDTLEMPTVLYTDNWHLE